MGSLFLNSRWLGVMQALERAVHVRFIFGINLEADSRSVAHEETTELVKGLGRGAIAAFELGNEPELYGSYSWYRTKSGTHVTGRPLAMTRDFLKRFQDRLTFGSDCSDSAGNGQTCVGWNIIQAVRRLAEPAVSNKILRANTLRIHQGRLKI